MGVLHMFFIRLHKKNCFLSNAGQEKNYLTKVNKISCVHLETKFQTF
jgi:hypothetical protein